MRLLDLLLPCPVCLRRATGASGCCAGCAAALFEPGAAGPLLWLGAYRGGLKRAVRALKFGGVTRLARLFAAALAAEAVRRGWRVDVVCPVPLHRARLRRRGFNQAALVAEPLAAALGAAYAPLLARTRPTAQQARLDRASRRANVRGAFASRPAVGLTVLVVDDVLTSGATSGACRASLLGAGARRVCVAVVARA